MVPKQNYLFLIGLLLGLFSFQNNSFAQCDCSYPIIFVHGWTSNAGAFNPLYTDSDFVNVWGPLSDTPDAVVNSTTSSHAYGQDAIKLTADDDMLFHVQFVNRSALAPGCIYAVDWDWQWDENATSPTITTNGSFPNSSNQSDSNQSSIEKQGYALGETIKSVLTANPTKKKVILMGHSMGGLASREYLQRVENGVPTWWVDPSDTVNGHKVAKVITVGTPHRGSNASALGLGGLLGFDEQSEAVRDLRFSYFALFSSRLSAPYLFGGSEDPNVTNSTRDSDDVDCDGDVDTDPIVSLNAVGSGNQDAWDGTTDNPSMSLPTNIKYSYYTSYSILGVTLNGGDGVVDLDRQWIYAGGDGGTSDYANGNSIPVPHDGIDYRLSDRIHSNTNYFHTDQTGDLDNMAKLLDEGDYPQFAFDIGLGVDYAGLTQRRADLVPNDSEYSGGANNIDGDWFVFELTGNTPGFDISITPNSNKAGRIDFYETIPPMYSNTNAPTYSNTWSAGQAAFTLNVTTGNCFSAGKYYLRITHEGLEDNAWRTPYKFRVDPLPCQIPDNPLAIDITALSTTLSWDKSLCASYEINWRAVSATNWNSDQVLDTFYHVNGLLPDAQYEFRVKSVCNLNMSTYTAITPFSTVACPDSLHITTNQIPEGIYAAGITITSDGYINDTSNITYQAGNSICLQPGFETSLGTVFLAEIQTCNPSIFNDPIAQTRTNVGKLNKPTNDDHFIPKKEFVYWKQQLQQQKDPYFRLVPLPNDTMKLEYFLDEDRLVNIEIYNSLNQYITTIISQKKQVKGWHSLYLEQAQFTPDIYLVDFKADHINRSDKMVLGPKLKASTELIQPIQNPESTLPELVKVYPNPFSNTLQIDLGILPSTVGIQFTLFDGTGRKIQSSLLQEKKNILDAKPLGAGLYFYEVINHKGVIIASGSVLKQ